MRSSPRAFSESNTASDQASERRSAELATKLACLVWAILDESVNAAADRPRVMRFILAYVFAMFAESMELIPARLFTNILKDAAETNNLAMLWSFFDDLCRNDRGNALFDCRGPRVALTPAQIQGLYSAAKDFDWQGIRPEILGSIFEQALDAAKRHELGAHFTRAADIARVIGPTIIDPWQERIRNARTRQDAERLVSQMQSFHVLDPACGCGNFLYVVYREMKRLEAAVVTKWTSIQRQTAQCGSEFQPPPPRPYFTLDQIHGLEKDEVAVVLARVVLWIGAHLARRELGLEGETLPVKNLADNMRHADALLTDWPRPAGELAIVGNPPYLGARKMRRELGDAYVERLFELFPDNRAADYVTYWFTKALDTLKFGERAGFVCTNSIAQNESRAASIDKIVAKGGTITDAWRSYPWPGEDVVFIGIVNWIMQPYKGLKVLDGQQAATISPGLRRSVDVTIAQRLAQNQNLCFMGVTPGNREFVLTDEQREDLLSADPQSISVIRPFLIGRDVNREVAERPTRWIIDFGTMSKEEAQRYKGAMRHVRKYVYPTRKNNRRPMYAEYWWRFVEPRPGLRNALAGRTQVLVIPSVGPHLHVSRQATTTCFDHQLMVIALPDYYHFGILQSRWHETWAWARGSTLKGDLRYTNTTIFETFPFPRLPKGTYDPRLRPETTKAERIAKAAKTFDELRRATCQAAGVGLTKVHQRMKEGEFRPLQSSYDALNEAVASGYGFSKRMGLDDDELLRQLLQQNLEVAASVAHARRNPAMNAQE